MKEHLFLVTVIPMRVPVPNESLQATPLCVNLMLTLFQQNTKLTIGDPSWQVQRAAQNTLNSDQSSTAAFTDFVPELRREDFEKSQFAINLFNKNGGVYKLLKLRGDKDKAFNWDVSP